MVARRERLCLAFDAEQAGDEVLEVRRERDEQLGFRLSSRWVASCFKKFFLKNRIKKRQKGAVDAQQAVALVQITEGKIKTEVHRGGDVTARRTVKIILFEGDPYADKE